MQAHTKFEQPIRPFLTTKTAQDEAGIVHQTVPGYVTKTLKNMQIFMNQEYIIEYPPSFYVVEEDETDDEKVLQSEFIRKTTHPKNFTELVDYMVNLHASKYGAGEEEEAEGEEEEEERERVIC